MPSYCFEEHIDAYDLDVEVEIEVRITYMDEGDRHCPPSLEWEVESIDVHTDGTMDDKMLADIRADIESRVSQGEWDDDLADACYARDGDYYDYGPDVDDDYFYL